MMRKMVLLAFLCVSLVSVSFADDAFWGSQQNPGSLALGDVVDDWTHLDAAPFKGTGMVFVTNTGNQAWGDFHFQVYSVPGFGSATSVAIKDATMGGMNPSLIGFGSMHSLDNWNIGTTLDGHAKIDLFYYTNPILPGQTVSFTIYTDNTAQQVGFFGLAFNPTPVPEPMTMVLLGLGSLVAFRKK